jgi:hypothetical protein
MFMCPKSISKSLAVSLFWGNLRQLPSGCDCRQRRREGASLCKRTIIHLTKGKELCNMASWLALLLWFLRFHGWR